MSEGNDDSGGSVSRDDMYKSNGEELVLALLSNLYSELEAISVSASGLLLVPPCTVY